MWLLGALKGVLYLEVTGTRMKLGTRFRELSMMASIFDNSESGTRVDLLWIVLNGIISLCAFEYYFKSQVSSLLNILSTSL